jgi:hypothetical protein
MVFCEAPFDGTMAPAVPASEDNGSMAAEMASALLEAAKEYFFSSVASSPLVRRDEDSVALFFEVANLE